MKALLLALMAVIAVSGPAHADGEPLSISQFHHSRWDVMEGGPSLAIAVSQAPDGFLWIVSADGLSRFDGVGFESFTSRQNPDAAAAIRSLLTTRSGGVWVGLGEFGGEELGEVLARTRLHPGGDFFGAEFEQKIGHHAAQPFLSIQAPHAPFARSRTRPI